jgi:hypothetical protein
MKEQKYQKMNVCEHILRIEENEFQNTLELQTAKTKRNRNTQEKMES